jgi:hypothetical protein
MRSRRLAIPFTPIISPVVKASHFHPAPHDVLPNQVHGGPKWRPDRPRKRGGLQGMRKEEQQPRTVVDRCISPETYPLKPGESIIYDTPLKNNWRPGNSVVGLRWHVSVAGSYVTPIPLPHHQLICYTCKALSLSGALPWGRYNINPQDGYCRQCREAGRSFVYEKPAT